MYNLQSLFVKAEFDFLAVVEQAAKKFNCNLQCVNECQALQPTLDGKASCLDVCLCFSVAPIPVHSTAGAQTFFQYEGESAANSSQMALYTLIFILGMAGIIFAASQVSKKREQVRRDNDLEEYLLLRD